MIKKIIRLGILLIMIISLLVLCACSKSSEKVVDTPGGQNTTSSKTDQNAEQANKTALATWANPTRKFDLNARNSVTQIAFSPDGKTLATGTTAGLMTWDAVSGQKSLNFNTYSKCLAYSPDGKVFASLGGSSSPSGNVIRLWDAVTGQELRTLSGIYCQNYYFAFSPDRKTMVSGGKDREVKFWDVASGQVIKSWNIKDTAGKIAFSPDGGTLAMIYNNIYQSNYVILWDVTSGTELRKLYGSNNEAITSFAFSPDGKTLAAGSADGDVKLWDVASGKELKTLKGPVDRYSIQALAYLPDGSALVLGRGVDYAIRLVDVNNGQGRTIFNTKYLPTAIAVSPDGKCLAAGDEAGGVAVWITR